MANPGRAPILRTKSVTKKEMNKCMAEIYDLAGLEPGPPGRQANTITTVLKRILSNAVVRYCI